MTTLADALEALTLLPDWEQRFAYVIELADELPQMPEEAKVEANLVRGCTSRVWMTHGFDAEDCLNLTLDSDAVLVRGLLALVWLAYAGKTVQQIKDTDLAAMLAPVGLLNQLSANRRSGLASVLEKVRGVR